MKRKRFQKDLAEALGISPAMVTKLKQAGMPINSIAAAKRWRDANLRHSLRKESRGWANDHDQLPAADDDENFAEIPAADTTSIDLVTRLASEAEKDFPRWEADLRKALRLVPVSQRDLINLPVTLWHALTAEFMRGIEAHEAADPKLAALRESETGAMTPEDVEYMSRFWYGVAIGAIRVAPIPGGQSND